MAKALEDYNTNDNNIELEIFGVTSVANDTALVKNTGDRDGNSTNGNQAYSEILELEGEDFPILESALEDDLCLVHVADNTVQEIIIPEILEEVTITSFKANTYIVVDGEQYDHAATAVYEEETLDLYTSVSNTINLKDRTYNVILDEYGYYIGLELVEDPMQFVFITGIDRGASNLANTQANMNAIFTDGTMATIKVNMTDSTRVSPAVASFLNLGAIVNIWCSYTVNNAGVYTLRAIPFHTSGGAVKYAQWAQNAYYTMNGDDSGSLSKDDGTYTIDR